MLIAKMYRELRIYIFFHITVLYKIYIFKYIF